MKRIVFTKRAKKDMKRLQNTPKKVDLLTDVSNVTYKVTFCLFGLTMMQ